ncbi:hypothetical protein JXA32_04215 [Candidatus Sumerlaeota bacterium]|nr:hypothetical protein [Candidatus Sumerlaeota bacterium]
MLLSLVLLCPVQSFSSDDPVEEIVGDAARALLLRDDGKLREAERQIRLYDARQRNLEEPPSGLRDNLLWLQALPEWGEPGVTEFSARGVLRSGADPMLRAQACDSLRKNPFWREAQLMRQAALDHAVTPLNSLFRAATGLLQGKLEPALRFGVDLVFYVPGFFQYSRQDGERYGVISPWLSSPDLPRRSRFQLERRHAALEPKIIARQTRIYTQQAQALLEERRYERARMMAEAALELQPSSKKAAALKRKAWRLEDQNKRWIRESNFVQANQEEQWTAGVVEEYTAAMRAMLLGDVAAMRETAGKLRRPLAAGELRATPDYLRAVAADIERDRPRALRRLNEGALAGAGTHLGAKAKAWTHSPDYNTPMLYEQLKSQRRRDTWMYVLLGRRSSRDRLYILSQTAVVPSTAAANMGIFAFIDAAIRGVQVSVNNPISTDPMRDAGFRVLESGQFETDEQLMDQLTRNMLRMAATPGEIEPLERRLPPNDAQLREKLRQVEANEAKRILRQARQHRDIEARRALCEYLLEKYPHSSEALKAKALLVKLPPEDTGESARINRALVRREVRYWRAIGLNIPEDWIDGLQSNGELQKDPAVTMRADQLDRVTYHLRNDRYVEDVIENGKGRRIYASMRLYQMREDGMEGFDRMLDYDRRPFELQGSIGSRGIDFSPRIGRAGERARELEGK